MFLLNLILLRCSSTIESFVDDRHRNSSEVKNVKQFLSSVNYNIKTKNGFNIVEVNCKKSITTHMPDDICILTKVTILRFNDSEISQLPSKFINLKNIICLDLSSNKFKVIPEEVFSLLKLRDLNCSNNVLECISPEIVNLECLTCLSVNNNALTSIPNCLYLLKNLRCLMFNKNNCQKISYDKSWLSTLREVPQMENLEILEIEKNNINAISEKFLPLKLKVLKISNNSLKSLPKSLSEWITLRELHIINNEFVTFPSIIFYIYSLEILSLKFIQIENELNLCNNILPNLKTLNLVIERIYPLKPLKIKSDKCKKFSLTVTKKGVFSLSRIISPNLEYLTLSNEIVGIDTDLKKDVLPLEINAEIPCLIKNMSLTLNDLKVLSIENTKYMDVNQQILTLKGLEGLKYLEDFRLTGVFLNEFPSEILEFTNLRTIDLAYNKISKIPNNIRRLQKLEYLDMRNNDLIEVNKNIFYIQTLKQSIFHGNSITYLPKEYKMNHNNTILLNIYGLHQIVSGDDLGFFDLAEKCFGNIKFPDIFCRTYRNPFQIYNFIETGSIRWNLKKVLSRKLDKVTKHKKNFEYINNIWTSYLLPNINDNDLLEVWDYITTVYEIPNSILTGKNENDVIRMNRIKDYIETIFNMLKNCVIKGKKDAVTVVFSLIKHGIKNNLEDQDQLKAFRIAFLSFNNNYDGNFNTKKFIHDVLGNIKENCLRKITTSGLDPQNIHIFYYWKYMLRKKLGFTNIKIVDAITDYEGVYQSEKYILYRFFKEFRPEAAIKEILEIINNNFRIVTNMGKFFLDKYKYDLSKIDFFVKYEGSIEDFKIHKITFEGVLYILKNFELMIEK